jgi:hypothetical protein
MLKLETEKVFSTLSLCWHTGVKLETEKISPSQKQFNFISEFHQKVKRRCDHLGVRAAKELGFRTRGRSRTQSVSSGRTKTLELRTRWILHSWNFRKFKLIKI